MVAGSLGTNITMYNANVIHCMLVCVFVRSQAILLKVVNGDHVKDLHTVPKLQNAKIKHEGIKNAQSQSVCRHA